MKYLFTCFNLFIAFFNPFSTNVPHLYPVKTSENQKFSDVFSRYKSETLVENGLVLWLYLNGTSSSLLVDN